ncbi:hypothetical protein DSO57_1003038 [Entomophthora muscae]|uniref:Uncharacterized protein n=1 Tax=Entomophthora muscae TaxID=34485 RepID=A0ACC2SXP9_9FUNG|nr:hypothetical protein DSO57_1003038 [Entomophthora muscae]
MTDRGQEFIGNEFNRLLKYWYKPTEDLAPAEVQVHGGDARLVIRKVLEEFSLMQAQYKLLASQHLLLGNDNSSKLVPGYDPGHNLGTSDQEPHMYCAPLLFQDKYNYLPAYQVPMTPPLTPQPDCPQESVATIESISTQLFGVM